MEKKCLLVFARPFAFRGEKGDFINGTTVGLLNDFKEGVDTFSIVNKSVNATSISPVLVKFGVYKQKLKIIDILNEDGKSLLLNIN